jgi:tetratricopeptide (TPR) repeat protein
MKFNRILLTLFFICSVALLANAQAWRGKGRLTGVVTDTQGKPIEGVVVKLANERLQAGTELKTDSKGKWAIAGIAGGTWNIDFSKEGYTSRSISSGVLELSYNKPIELKLEPAKVSTAAGGTEKKAVPGLDLVQEGNRLVEAKDYAGAIAKFQQAMQLNPDFFELWGDIGQAYERTNQLDQAVDAYKKLLEKQPENKQALMSIANIWLQKKNLDEAKKVLSTLKDEDLTDAGFLYNLGASFYNANDMKDAARYLQLATQVNPQMGDAYLQLGFALASPQINDKEGAKKAFQKVIELDPNSENAKAAQEYLASMK